MPYFSLSSIEAVRCSSGWLWAKVSLIIRQILTRTWSAAAPHGLSHLLDARHQLSDHWLAVVDTRLSDLLNSTSGKAAATAEVVGVFTGGTTAHKPLCQYRSWLFCFTNQPVCVHGPHRLPPSCCPAVVYKSHKSLFSRLLLSKLIMEAFSTEHQLSRLSSQEWGFGFIV